MSDYDRWKLLAPEDAYPEAEDHDAREAEEERRWEDRNGR